MICPSGTPKPGSPMPAPVVVTSAGEQAVVGVVNVQASENAKPTVASVTTFHS